MKIEINENTYNHIIKKGGVFVIKPVSINKG
jgi:hypothetical protein